MKLTLFIFILCVFTHLFAVADEISINDAVKALENKKYDIAITQYNSLIKNIDNNASLYYGRGMAYYYSDQYDSAKQDFNKAISLNNIESIKYSDAYLGLAMTYIQEGKNKDAANVLNKAITNGIITDELKYTHGLVMYMEQNYMESISSYDFVLSNINSKLYNDALYGRAIAYYKLNDYDNAKNDFEKCLQLIDAPTIKNECSRMLSYINK